jgi:ketosteroid isomerase-like protein
MGTVQEEITRILREWEAAFAAGDFDGVAALYTHDAIFLSGPKAIRGRDAIRDAYARFAEAGTKRYRFDTVELEDLGGIVLELGELTAYGGSGELLGDGHYVIAWKRESDGVLRAHWDIYSDEPLVATSGGP